METNNTKQIEALIEKSAPRKHELTYGEGDDKLTIGVYPVIRFKDRADMIHEIANGVFTDAADNIKTYHPELLEFVKKSATLRYFTDCALPENVEEQWVFINYTPVYDDVAGIVGEELGEIFDAADKTINARKQYLANKTDVSALFKRIGDAISGLEAKIPKEEIDKVLESLKGMPGNESLQDTIKSLLGSVNTKQN